jgi:sulfate permease, SulP family
VTAQGKRTADTQRRPTLFRGILPLDRSGLAANLAAGVSLAAMNIPQAMGYAKIAGTPVITGLYTLLLPLVAFAAFGRSSTVWRLF